jgi:hypothetical protein
MQTGVVPVGSNGSMTGGSVPGGRFGIAAVESEFTCARAELSSISAE